MKLTTCYTSSNSNQVPTVVDWGKNDLICYGSCNSVFIYDSNYGSGGKVTHVLIKHTKRVNSVKWLTGKDIINEKELISGSTDGDVCVWTLVDDKYESVILKSHTLNVNIVDGLYKGENCSSAVIVSISMDRTAKIWFRQNLTDNFTLNQTLNFDYHIGLAVRLSFLPNSNELLLACALDDSKIHIFSETKSDIIEYEKSTILTGHEDWVRGLDLTVDGNDLVLASCSQDAFIRLWRLTEKTLGTEMIEKTQITTKYQKFNVYTESVLSGHEGWVYSVKWSPSGKQLLSASIDKSMIIWEYDENSELWLEKMRVGEIGGNTLGFYGGLFGPTGDTVLGHSYHGAFHIWKNSEKLNCWLPCVTLGGHFGEVIDCAWEPQGQFLFTLSSDQTTRIHAPWKSQNKKATWHEIARPQVHGYDMNSLAVISRYQIASGAEEKVIRVFQAPINFVENFRRICSIDKDEEGDSVLKFGQVGPKGASVPSLGLSNKAVYCDDNFEQTVPIDKKNPYPEESQFTATELTEPPTEETLVQNTLWPEAQKLYGHGYEVYCLAASSDGKFLASACKSSKPEHAAVLLWDTSNWKLVQKLMSHTLTVVQLQFSPDNKHLLSVSRDRRWSLFTKQDDQFQLEATTDKNTAVHSRIIWSCSWSHDSTYFATGSRDGKIAVWSLNKNEERSGPIGKCGLASDPFVFKNESITALAFAPALVSDKYLLAAGLDNGRIELFNWTLQEWHRISIFSEKDYHHLTVKRIAFRPVFGEAGENEDENVLQLASCSSDYSVKIFNIFINE
ncbi:unnamed protein product [Psylliodes chrysocephalus]|uniref:Elongator complex protein 2 n=1 Tax=Psylliodes chrysocephalus TaxID=3402493 RepID=A0A9P0CP70_9CUCU|nr:unnamed protein product [Psylliodes chrysocephala]